MTKIIAVFGSARVQPAEKVYQQSYQVGHALAQAGYVTMTGGYAGVMEAASKGASEGDGHALGITVASLEYIGESRTNQWVAEEIRYETLPERVKHLVDVADAYIVMPGGIGTAQELVEVWQQMRLGDLPEKPLFIYGDFWKPMIQSMLDENYIDERDMKYILEANSAEEIIDALDSWFSQEQS